MIGGKPGISSFDMFATGHAIRQELKALGGNIFNINSTLMKISNGDDNGRAGIDSGIGAREVRRQNSRQIGKTVSSTSGGLGPMSTAARSANLLGNPYMRRYEGPDSNGKHNFGLDGSPAIGEYYDVYESESNHLRFMDDTVGKDLLGYTHLIDAATERSGEATNDKLYMRSTYSMFNDIEYPFDEQDVETFKLGPKRYSPSEPYVLKPLESNLTRRTLDGNVQTFQDKFEAVVEGRERYNGSLIDMWDFMGSHYYLNVLNGVAEHGLYVENYQNDQRNRVMVYDRDNIPQSDYDYFLNVDTVNPDKDIKGLLGKTNRMFYEGKIRSLVNRFATLNHNNEGRPDFLNTATDHTYGLSRGRNLRKLDLTNENGYPNPYCRVWTTHYQYAKYKNLIRGKWAGDDKNVGAEHYTLHQGDQLMRPNKGYERLKNFSAIDTENGRPIYSPYYVNNRDTLEKDSIKKCMFSIENLAWKDIIPDSSIIRRSNDDSLKLVDESLPQESRIVEDGYTANTLTKSRTYKGKDAKGLGMTLTEEQRGPNGGRIMWFPPYNLKFSEQLHADWNPNDFIGRGEKIYSYVNSERTGTLSFTILVDHPSIINEWARGGKQGKTGNKVDPLSKDEMILRYFAGCDTLDFNPREEYNVPYSVVEEDTTINSWQEVTETTSEKVSKMVKKEEPNDEPDITFYSVFYFPNDYSAGDFMGQEVAKADYNGTLANRRKEQKPTDCKAAIDEILNHGERTTGIGYELGQGLNNTGMTYQDIKKSQYYDNATGKDGKEKYWYYAVDSRVNNEVLVNSQRYKDMKDHGLNGSKNNESTATIYGTFWSGVPGEDKILEYLSSGNTDVTEGEDLNMAKYLVNLSSADNKYLIPAYNFYNHLEEVVKKLDAATNNRYRYKITVQGFASSHGYSSTDENGNVVTVGAKDQTIDIGENAKSNEILAANRAAVIAGWIQELDCFDFNGENARDVITHNGNGQVPSTNTSTESDLKPKAARAAVVTFEIIPSETKITDVQEYEDIENQEKKTVKNVEERHARREVFHTEASSAYTNQTYDNEYTYFKQINENDDMVKRYISDKVDYFDPAYHSITPEGFNARLTFLQQCMRQGPTISASDSETGSKYGAGNLSFGRAPFCVLRIGDFFNTKICIQSINIEYDNNGVQWDLNPEGVGLQPMFANVNITFTFLGGSDISGPISRLQNAASFNYYANTSVYDRRSDYRESYVTPEDDTAKSWNPMILNKNEDANITEHHDFRTRPTKKE